MHNAIHEEMQAKLAEFIGLSLALDPRSGNNVSLQAMLGAAFPNLADDVNTRQIELHQWLTDDRSIEPPLEWTVLDVGRPAEEPEKVATGQ